MAGFVATMRYNKFVAITPSDTVDLPDGPCDAFYVGGAGNVAVVADDNRAVTFIAAAVGSTMCLKARRINVTNTTATNLVALYLI